MTKKKKKQTLLKDLEENEVFCSKSNPDLKGYVIRHSPMGTTVRFISAPNYQEVPDDNSPLNLKEYYTRKPIMVGSDMIVEKINIEKEIKEYVKSEKSKRNKK